MDGRLPRQAWWPERAETGPGCARGPLSAFGVALNHTLPLPGRHCPGFRSPLAVHRRDPRPASSLQPAQRQDHRDPAEHHTCRRRVRDLHARLQRGPDLRRALGGPACVRMNRQAAGGVAGELAARARGSGALFPACRWPAASSATRPTSNPATASRTAIGAWAAAGPAGAASQLHDVIASRRSAASRRENRARAARCHPGRSPGQDSTEPPENTAPAAIRRCPRHDFTVLRPGLRDGSWRDVPGVVLGLSPERGGNPRPTGKNHLQALADLRLIPAHDGNPAPSPNPPASRPIYWTSSMLTSADPAGSPSEIPCAKTGSRQRRKPTGEYVLRTDDCWHRPRWRCGRQATAAVGS